MLIALAWAFKDESHVQEMSTWQKRLSKAEFLKLSKSARERYIKLYPHSSHRFLMGKGDPDNVEGGQQMKKVEPTGRHRFPSEEEIQAKRAKRLEHTNTRKEIADFNKSNTAVINPQSLQALDNVKDSHLRQAADGINRNKSEIVATVQQQAKKLPNMYGKGLAATRELVSGETHPDDMSTTKKHAMHRVLGGIATMALLGAGVMACGMAAAPLGVLMGVTLFNMWAGSKHGKNLRDDINELKNAREKKRRQERLENGSFDPDENERIQRRLAKRAKDQETAVASGGVFDFDAPDTMTDQDTIGLILDHVSDLLQYHSVRDFQEHRDEMFAGASAANNEFLDLKYLLRFAHCDNFQQSGDGMIFSCAGGTPTLEKLFRRMGYMVSATEDGDNVAYHFDNGKGRATVGNCDAGLYIRYDGDFDYRTAL
jgi:hypothetical protein|uniref:Uncharacterized protein n=1 Tax=Myoviridae sp. ctshb19 TaxID=2825194 RepID=A0A8S5UGT3_9CAUD|nr:MAG TPA: hypothetical protein [Myoviridae sp. ctshb19]